MAESLIKRWHPIGCTKKLSVTCGDCKASIPVAWLYLPPRSRVMLTLCSSCCGKRAEQNGAYAESFAYADEGRPKGQKPSSKRARKPTKEGERASKKAIKRAKHTKRRKGAARRA